MLMLMLPELMLPNGELAGDPVDVDKTSNCQLGGWHPIYSLSLVDFLFQFLSIFLIKLIFLCVSFTLFRISLIFLCSYWKSSFAFFNFFLFLFLMCFVGASYVFMQKVLMQLKSFERG